LLKILEYKLLLVILVLVVSCNTNPPTDVGNDMEYGEVYISANVNGAEIFVDGVNSGLVTPDTLALPAGDHEIEVRKSGYSSEIKSVNVAANSGNAFEFNIQVLSGKKVVLIEDFANVSCGPCVYTNAIIKVVWEQYGSDNLVIVQYPTNFPSPTDPFYLANSNDANTRIGYYNIFAAPSVIIDGDERPIATDAADIKERIDRNLLETPGINIDVSDSLTTENYISIVSVTSLVNLQNPEDYDLIINVTENNINFDTPPGSNGETEFNHVMRKMHKLDLATVGSVDGINIEKVTPINSIWLKQNLNTVVFIQNKMTKAVIQANSSE